MLYIFSNYDIIYFFRALADALNNLISTISEACFSFLEQNKLIVANRDWIPHTELATRSLLRNVHQDRRRREWTATANSSSHCFDYSHDSDDSPAEDESSFSVHIDNIASIGENNGTDVVRGTKEVVPHEQPRLLSNKVRIAIARLAAKYNEDSVNLLFEALTLYDTTRQNELIRQQQLTPSSTTSGFLKDNESSDLEDDA